MLRIEMASEDIEAKRPARILIYEDDTLLEVIIAEIKPQKIINGKMCSCVELKKYDQPEFYDLLNRFLSGNPEALSSLAQELGVASLLIMQWAKGIIYPAASMANKKIIPKIKELMQKQDN